MTNLRRGIQEPRHPITRMPHFLEDPRPFPGFQRYTVRSVKPSGDEPDRFGRRNLREKRCAHAGSIIAPLAFASQILALRVEK